MTAARRAAVTEDRIVFHGGHEEHEGRKHFFRFNHYGTIPRKLLRRIYPVTATRHSRML